MRRLPLRHRTVGCVIVSRAAVAVMMVMAVTVIMPVIMVVIVAMIMRVAVFASPVHAGPQ
jgi:Na+/H+ antiporter NhaA